MISNYKEYLRNIKLNSKSLYRDGFFHLLGSNYIIKVFGFSSQLFVGWILLKEDIGRIGVLQNFFGIFLVFAGFGFNSSILKYSSEDISESEKYTIYSVGDKFAIITCIFTYILAVVLSQFNFFSPDLVINKYIPLFFLSLLPLTLNTNFLSYLQAIQKIKLYSKLQLFTKIIGIILLIILTYFYLLKGYILALVISNTISMIVLQYYRYRIRKKKLANKFLKKHLNYALPSLMANFLGILTYNSDLLIINYLIIDRDLVGSYSFALVLLNMLMIISSSSQQFLIPKFSFISSSFPSVVERLKKYQKKWIPFAIVLLALSICATVPFLYWFKDGKFQDSITPFIILAFSWIFRSLVMLQGGMFFGAGYVKLNLINTVIHLILNSLLMYIGFKAFGFIGIPIGILISCIFRYIFTQVEINYILKTNYNE